MEKMYDLLREMIHYRNCIDPEMESDQKTIIGYEEKYHKKLQQAREEYECIPAYQHYKDGYNLHLNMAKIPENHLLFLHDLRVLANNILAEGTQELIKENKSRL